MPAQRKIALISEHASPLAVLGGVDSGGQNVYVDQLARQLGSRGHKVDVFTRSDGSAPREIVELDRYRVVHVPAGPRRFIPKEALWPHMRAFSRWMIDFIRRCGSYDVVHANFWMSGQAALDLKRAMGIPFAVTFHALGKVRLLHQGSADRFPSERCEVERRVIAGADAVIAECPQDHDDLARLYGAPSERITVIPCGFDLREFSPLPKARARAFLGLERHDRIVLQLGRLVPRKGIDTVIEALAHLLKRDGTPATLVVVGGGDDGASDPELARLKAVAQSAGVEERVVFAGRAGRQILRYFYGACDVFVTVPWYEPFGMTPLEAMACARPVVGSAVGGIKYTVLPGKTGYLVPPKSPQALAERLAFLFRHPLHLAWLGERAVERAQKFSWARIADQVEALYERIKEEAHAPAGGVLG